MSETQRETYLSELHVGVLSVAADGRPPASYPIWYDYVPGGEIRVNTNVDSRKAKLIEAAGAVTLVVQDEQPPYKFAVVEGTVVRTVTPTPQDIREQIAYRYLGPERGQAFVDSLDADRTVLYHIRPDRWITADYSGEV